MKPLPVQVIQKKLQKLASFQNKKNPILSLYLYNDTTIKNEEVDMVIKSFLTTEESDLFAEELQTVKTYIENNKLSGTVFFISDGLFEEITHEFIIPSQCFIGHTPYIALLEKAVTGYSLAIVLGNKKIMLAILYKGRIENYKEVNIIKISKNKILQKIIEDVQKMLRGRKLNEIFIGGESIYTKKIIQYLPLHLKLKIKGTFLSSTQISEQVVIEHILHTAGVLEKEFPQ